MQAHSGQFLNRLRSPKVFRCLGFCCAVVSMFDTSGRGDCPRYSVQLVQPMGNCGIFSEHSTPMGVSEHGDLVGYGACGGGNDRAQVAWGGAQLVTLSLPNTFWSRAEGINSNSQIVGTMELNGVGNMGFIYQNGQVTQLNWLSGHNWCEAHAINDAVIAVGFSGDVQIGPGEIACRWVNGIIESLAVPDPQGSNAHDINDSGQIVGYMGHPPSGALLSEAFLWQNGKTTPLGRPVGATNSNANAISNNGTICGHYSLADPQGAGGYKRRALAWIGGQMVDLGTLSGFLQSRAMALNDADEIVGYCDNPPLLGGNSQGFIRRNGTMINLDSVLAPGSTQYHVRHAWGINNNGQIAVDVGGPSIGSRSALLIPVIPRLGDTNCDWLVNVNDLLNVINHWGPYSPPPGGAGLGTPDLNADGSVNVNDLLAVINNWG